MRISYVYEYVRERRTYNIATRITGFETRLERIDDFQRMINMYVSVVQPIRNMEARVPSIYRVWCMRLRDALNALIE